MTEILRFSLKAVKRAGEVVRGGGVIVFPTDTLYGIGCDPLDDDAVNRIYRIKRRPGKPMPVLTNSLKKALEIASMSRIELDLVSRLWPGQLTIILNASGSMRESRIISKEGKVGVRIPASIQALTIIEESGGLLVGTSANISGKSPPKKFSELEEAIINSADLAIDGGECPIGKPSTVVEVVDKRVNVLRHGAVAATKLRYICEDLGLTLHIEDGDSLED